MIIYFWEDVARTILILLSVYNCLTCMMYSSVVTSLLAAQLEPKSLEHFDELLKKENRHMRCVRTPVSTADM